MKNTTTTIAQRAKVAPAAFSLESVYGSVKPSRKPEDFDEIARIAKEDKVESILRELSESC